MCLLPDMGPLATLSCLWSPPTHVLHCKSDVCERFLPVAVSGRHLQSCRNSRASSEHHVGQGVVPCRLDNIRSKKILGGYPSAPCFFVPSPSFCEKRATEQRWERKRLSEVARAFLLHSELEDVVNRYEQSVRELICQTPPLANHPDDIGKARCRAT